LVLEWPIEGLEPLSFVLARLLDPLCGHLDRRDRGAVVVHTWLKLVTRDVWHRALELPAPMRDPKVLRTLILLDLESHPPGAGIDEVRVSVEPAPARQVQHSLLVRPLPPPDRLSTLTARLTALMGSGRAGSPDLLDTHRPEACAVVPFAPTEQGGRSSFSSGSPEKELRPPSSVLRRFRRALPARVVVDGDGHPARVTANDAAINNGTVVERAGPWRTSGEWWANGWDRDEWDVALADRAIYRVHRDRATGQWFVEGVWD
jgi:protein ImuB